MNFFLYRCYLILPFVCFPFCEFFSLNSYKILAVVSSYQSIFDLKLEGGKNSTQFFPLLDPYECDCPPNLYFVVDLTASAGGLQEEKNPVVLELRPKESTSGWSVVHSCYINKDNSTCRFRWSNFHFAESEYRISIHVANENSTLWVFGFILMEVCKEPFLASFSTFETVDPGEFASIPLLPFTQFVAGSVNATLPDVEIRFLSENVIIHSCVENDFGWGLSLEDYANRPLSIEIHNARNLSFDFSVSLFLQIGIPSAFANPVASTSAIVDGLQLAPLESGQIHVETPNRNRLLWDLGVIAPLRLEILQNGETALSKTYDDPSELFKRGSFDLGKSQAKDTTIVLTNLQRDRFQPVGGIIGIADLSETEDFVLENEFGPFELPPVDDVLSEFVSPLLSGLATLEWSLVASEPNCRLTISDTDFYSVYEFTTTESGVAGISVDMKQGNMNNAVQLSVSNLNHEAIVVESLRIKQTVPGKGLSGMKILGIVMVVLVVICFVFVAVGLAIFVIVRRKRKAAYKKVESQ